MVRARASAFSVVSVFRGCKEEEEEEENDDDHHQDAFRGVGEYVCLFTAKGFA